MIPRWLIFLLAIIEAVVIVLAFCGVAVGHSADINGSGVVDFGDYWYIARDWQTSPTLGPNGDIDHDGIVDFNDLLILAAQWLDGVVGNPPVVTDINLSICTYITEVIDLADYTTDDGIPVAAELTYIIVSVPDDSNIYIQDPASGCGKITAALCPYTLRNHGSTVWLAADNTEAFNFKWKANDSTSDSNEANCIITACENPHDHLSFDGLGVVTIPDHDYMDIAGSGWACSFWYQNLKRKPFDTIIKKRDGGAGWEVVLVSGKLQVNLYDANGLVASHTASGRISDGTWWDCLIEYKDDTGDANDKYVSISYCQSEFGNYNADYSEAFTPSIYTNAESVIINPTAELDHLRFWNDAAGDILWPQVSRDNYTESFFGLGNDSEIRFKMDKGSGVTITDDKLGLVGTFSDSDHVKWTPWNWYWADINILR